MTPAKEEILIRKCIAGNGKYQEMLYQEYSRKFMGVCMRYAKSREEAEDFLQEGFCKIFYSLKQYEGKGSFEGWMRRVIVNTILQLLRKKPVMFSETEMWDLSDESQDESIWSNLNMQDLVHQIQQLPAGYRMV